MTILTMSISSKLLVFSILSFTIFGKVSPEYFGDPGVSGIIGMSLINSIFVDSMAEDNNEEVLD